MPLVRSLTAVTLLFLVVCPRLSAQTTYATITGTVTDSSGGVIKGAAVVATNVETSVTTKTDNEQRRRVHRDAAARRARTLLSITAPGLREFLAADIVLVTRDVRRIDAVLEVGGLEAAVQVTGGNAPIELETPRVSDVRTAEQLRTLPLNDPGRLVVSGDHAVARRMRGGGYSFAGSRSNQSAFSIDGTSMTDGVGENVDRAARQLHRVVQGSEDRSWRATAPSRRASARSPSSRSRERIASRASVFDYYQSPMFRARNPFSGAACPPASCISPASRSAARW